MPTIEGYLLGAVLGISLWLLVSGLVEYFRRPKTFSFVLRKSDLKTVSEDELPEDVEKYRRELEEKLVSKIMEERRKRALLKLKLSVVGIIIVMSALLIIG
ncbi:hypothetical protein TON_0099 [Thermococcus onnurineus NA1]|uniref:Uncharacterized protein n=1 Tax=Thermococcus onnurineus (strain NA1) TaxID=523850 RepID=B6YSP7_THEON|nr:hypothetical protein [Thermococcus onnurineus]ACJ15584.1 hypothetical protein TON_0099 [Thermococcus onnurineus NA1]